MAHTPTARDHIEEALAIVQELAERAHASGRPRDKRSLDTAEEALYAALDVYPDTMPDTPEEPTPEPWYDVTHENSGTVLMLCMEGHAEYSDNGLQYRKKG